MAHVTLLNQQVMSGLSSLFSPIPPCWGRRGSLQAWREGRGHLSVCRAPPGECCCLWSPPSPERTALSLAQDRSRWEYRPAARRPWSSSGSAPWKPLCVRGRHREGCLGWWRLRMEEGGHLGAGYLGICRLRTAEGALGNGKHLPRHHQKDAGEWGRCQRRPGRSRSLGLVFQG